MSLFVKSCLAFAATLSLTFSAVASESATHGNADAGKAKSATCAGCHGADGNSMVPSFPKIAGQPAGYIAAQLATFKSGERADATMKGMVAALSAQDMLDLDAYYSTQKPTVGEISAEQEEAARTGEALYRTGSAEFSITACTACHGPAGKGVQPNYPRLAGQYAGYIETQLLAFKNGTRKDAMMSAIAFPLTAEQIKQLSVYVSGLY